MYYLRTSGTTVLHDISASTYGMIPIVYVNACPGFRHDRPLLLFSQREKIKLTHVHPQYVNFDER